MSTDFGKEDEVAGTADLPMFRLGVGIWRAGPPVLLTLGTVGNALSAFVLSRPSIRSSPTAVCLAVLACTDLLVLYTGLLRQWLQHTFHVDVRHVSDAGCKIHTWLVYTSLDYSAWILLLLTVERVVYVWFPIRAKVGITRKSIVVALIVVLSVIMTINAHILFGFSLEKRPTDPGQIRLVCGPKTEQYKRFIEVQWPWIDLLVFCFIPFVVIVAGNTLIMKKLWRRRPFLTSSNSTSRSQTSNVAMLMTLSAVFLITTSPVSIYLVMEVFLRENDSTERQAEMFFWWSIVNILMYANNSLNFLFYCLSGTKFREELLRLWKCPQNTDTVKPRLETGHRRENVPMDRVHSAPF